MNHNSNKLAGLHPFHIAIAPSYSQFKSPHTRWTMHSTIVWCAGLSSSWVSTRVAQVLISLWFDLAKITPNARCRSVVATLEAVETWWITLAQNNIVIIIYSTDITGTALLPMLTCIWALRISLKLGLIASFHKMVCWYLFLQSDSKNRTVPKCPIPWQAEKKPGGNYTTAPIKS